MTIHIDVQEHWTDTKRMASRRDVVRKFFGAVVATLSLSVLVFAQPAFGQDAEKEQPHEHEYVFEKDGDAWTSDVGAMATSKGLSFGGAEARLQLVQDLGDMQQKVLENPWLVESYAGAAVLDDGSAVVYLKGDTAAAFTGLLPAGAKVVDGLKYNAEQLDLRARRTHTQLAKMGFTNIMTSYDVATSSVDAMVSSLKFDGVNTSFLADSNAVVAALPKWLQTGLSFEMIDGPIGEDLGHASVGGMEALDDGVFECTIGWPVQEIGGAERTGITTAGHCTGIDEAQENPSFALVDLSHVRQHRGAFGDIEWKTTSGPARAQFIADQNDSLRNVNSVEPIGNLVVGESICMFGQSSNSRDCTMDVRRTSVSCTVSNIRNDRLVEMDDDSTQIGGDSGGGWSFGTRAYGSVKGRCGGRAVFSFADHYDSAINVRVMTQ